MTSPGSVGELVASVLRVFPDDDVARICELSLAQVRAWELLDFPVEKARKWKHHEITGIDPVQIGRLQEMRSIADLAVRLLPNPVERDQWMQARNPDLNMASPLDAVRLYRWDLARSALRRREPAAEPVRY